ncbi:MAG: PqqD family protein [Calditrichaceae bacterium]|jgi:hypothetical protein
MPALPFFIYMKIKTTTQLLQCKPSQTADFDTNPETGLVQIIKPKFKSDWARKMFTPFIKGENFIINLDELGTEVWNNCNGKTTVEEIGEILGKKFGPEIEPIYDRLNKFILQLLRSKFIQVDCPQKSETH